MYIHYKSIHTGFLSNGLKNNEKATPNGVAKIFQIIFK
jgi:hypothetical protein|nr:MAG TPA: hypothetical protein [Caudoviricetes sp.]